MGMHIVYQGSKMIMSFVLVCGANWLRKCKGGLLLYLLFWYCGNSCALDAYYPAMNVALLILFAGYAVDSVVREAGYEVYN